jgi:uncharacterized SAM-binding protein YcdF (DUF218 family)
MSVIFLSILIILAILAIFRKKKKLAIILQIIFLISFYLSGSGLAVLFLMPHLELSANHKNIAPAWQKNNVIVVLGAGNIKLPQSNIIKPSFFSYSRIYEAANLYFLCKKSANQCNIITSGGDVSKFGKSEAEIYFEHLIALGVNKDDIILESKSNNTYQNAEFSSVIIKAKKYDQVFLVTSSLHLKRSLLYFSNFAITLKPIMADYVKPQISLIPIGYNFAITDFVIHEYIGIARFYVYNFLGLNKHK